MKKSGIILATKILMMIPILLSLALAINAILIGITKVDYLPRIFPMFSGVLISYVLAGIATLIVAIILAIKILKE
jgi:uncharacterized membrane protein YuzA (DUF378 family)